jgi:hypothetical protein
VEPRDFRPTKEQLAFYEGGPRRIDLNAGVRSGRRYATELWIRHTTVDDEEAELALEDLRTFGIAMIDSNGRRVKSGGKRRFTIVRFDEEPRPRK